MSRRIHAAAWLGGTSLFLGALALLSVAAFHFPDLLTGQTARGLYSEDQARGLLRIGLMATYASGVLALALGGGRWTALAGLLAATLAMLAGGSEVPLAPIRQTPWSLALDWFVLSLLFSALVFVPLERGFRQREQSVLRPEWRTDLAYFFVSHAGVQFILLAVTSWAAALAGIAMWPWLADQIRALPFWLQFPLAVLVADIVQVSVHRAFHGVPLLWRFHAVHHSVRHMDWLAGSRLHLVDILATRSLVLAPLLALGFSVEALNAYVILAGLQAVLAHANLRLRAGWLEYLLVLPRYHHWHHARHPDYAHANFAIHLPLIDMLFRSFRLPAGEWPESYGLLDPDSVPQGILAQHLRPFRSTPDTKKAPDESGA
jgi:sterol desaturase/sphingolipid hydroxylase (fatty acid hydroxylase superfamily)